MRIGSLFTGAAGLDRAVESVFGAKVQWFSETDSAAAKVLAHHYPTVPNLGDVRTIPWRDVEPIDILAGGFPCVDVSVAGLRAGMHNTHSGLWSHMVEAIDVLRPRYVVIENVRGLLSANAHRPVESDPNDVGAGPDGFVLRAMGAVLGDLSDLGGYEARWFTVPASAAGAPHLRERVFILAFQPGAELTRVVCCPETGQGIDLLPTPCASDRFGAGPHGVGGMDLRTTLASLELSESGIVWGKYEKAIKRWEKFTRPAPPAMERGESGIMRLAAAFSEWMMGWPSGWVTDPAIGVSRKSQLRILGNGVVTRQAELALRLLASA